MERGSTTNDRADPHQLHRAHFTLSAKRRADLSSTLARLAACQGTASCQVR